MTHMQISAQFRKPRSPLKQPHPLYITSPPCVPICCKRQEMGSLHSSETVLHSLQHTIFQMVKVHINNTNHITIANIYIPPRDSTDTHYKTADTDIQHCIQYITNIPHSIFTGDVNAHSTLWHSYTNDHRGKIIADVISNLDHITQQTHQPECQTPHYKNIITRCHHGVICGTERPKGRYKCRVMEWTWRTLIPQST